MEVFGQVPPDFEHLIGQELVAARLFGVLPGQTRLSCDRAIFMTRLGGIELSVGLDTDQIVVASCRYGEPIQGGEPLLNGHPPRLGWLWVGRNYLDCSDLVAISLNGIGPTIGFIAEGGGLTAFSFDYTRTGFSGAFGPAMEEGPS